MLFAAVELSSSVVPPATLLFVSLMSLVRLRGRASWLAVVLGGLAIATPQILIYQGIVWRDVILRRLAGCSASRESAFANCSW